MNRIFGHCSMFRIFFKLKVFASLLMPVFFGSLSVGEFKISSPILSVPFNDHRFSSSNTLASLFSERSYHNDLRALQGEPPSGRACALNLACGTEGKNPRWALERLNADLMHAELRRKGVDYRHIPAAVVPLNLGKLS